MGDEMSPKTAWDHLLPSREQMRATVERVRDELADNVFADTGRHWAYTPRRGPVYSFNRIPVVAKDIAAAWGALWAAQVALRGVQAGGGKDNDCWCGDTSLPMGEHEPWCVPIRAIFGVA